MKRSRRMTMTTGFDAIVADVRKGVVSVGDLCREAEINESTWYRWTREDDPISPNMRTLEKVQKAHKKLKSR